MLPSNIDMHKYYGTTKKTSTNYNKSAIFGWCFVSFVGLDFSPFKFIAFCHRRRCHHLCCCCSHSCRKALVKHIKYKLDHNKFNGCQPFCTCHEIRGQKLDVRLCSMYWRRQKFLNRKSRESRRDELEKCLVFGARIQFIGIVRHFYVSSAST